MLNALDTKVELSADFVIWFDFTSMIRVGHPPVADEHDEGVLPVDVLYGYCQPAAATITKVVRETRQRRHSAKLFKIHKTYSVGRFQEFSLVCFRVLIRGRFYSCRFQVVSVRWGKGPV